MSTEDDAARAKLRAFAERAFKQRAVTQEELDEVVEALTASVLGQMYCLLTMGAGVLEALAEGASPEQLKALAESYRQQALYVLNQMPPEAQEEMRKAAAFEEAQKLRGGAAP